MTDLEQLEAMLELALDLLEVLVELMEKGEQI